LAFASVSASSSLSWSTPSVSTSRNQEVAQPISKHFNAGVAKETTTRQLSSAVMHDRADHIDDDGLVFSLDAIDRIDERRGVPAAPTSTRSCSGST